MHENQRSVRTQRLVRSVILLRQKERTLADLLSSYRAVHTRPSRSGTIPAIHEHAVNAVQSVSRENRFAEHGDNFASTSSVLIKSPFSEMPNSNSCDEFSVSELQRHQIVLFTLR